MTKTEITRWLTPNLSPRRLVFITFGGSANGQIRVEQQDVETDTWETVEKLGRADGVPEMVGEKVSDATINQFTGEVSE